MRAAFTRSGAVSLTCLTLLSACGSSAPPNRVEGRQLRTERDSHGLLTCSPATAGRTCYTNRAVMGVSMGAAGAGQLGIKHPELFDSVGMLGVPLIDWVWMMRLLERGYLGGFCKMEDILAHAEDLARPDGRAYCGPAPSVVKLEPSGKILEPAQDFNHWYRWIDEGRGGSFGRNKLRDSFQDIALAFGNPVLYNPESPYFPPGVPIEFRQIPDQTRCARPLAIHGFKDARYNPTGEYDVLAFCDTNSNGGDFDQRHPSERATEILLAVDYNRNGIRDYAEPIIVQAHEPYRDTGVTPGDSYDPDTNPKGTAGNGRYDPGEPFDDFGLDGIPNTGDYGEGNGKFDNNPNVDNIFDQDPRTQLEKMPQGHLDRLNIYADAGIRDFLESAGAGNWLWAALKARVGSSVARDYTTFLSLTPGTRDYDFLAVDYSPKGIGKHAYVRYGDPDANERDIHLGDGHHVGPPEQVLSRFLTAVAFVQSRFLDPDKDALTELGEVSDLGMHKRFFSNSLGREREYGILLPPGYDRPQNATKRYPVVYFLHGQGMESSSLLAAGILFFGYMGQSSVVATQRARQSDWAKFIIVFPDSTCDQDNCKSGNFNTNHKGLDGHGPRYQDSLFDLMAVIEANYRVAPPVEVPIAR